MDDLGNSIISGVAGGAIAGIVVSAILAAYRLVAAKWRRREQISHIREMIANEHRYIAYLSHLTHSLMVPR